jgi:hypothetical protein
VNLADPVFLAREDALRLRKLTNDAKDRRIASSSNGPPPSQRAMDSLRAVRINTALTALSPHEQSSWKHLRKVSMNVGIS